MATLEHGRTRYVRGCRCETYKSAERDYQRERYRRRRGLPVDPPKDPPELGVVGSAGESSYDGVAAAVRAELDATPGCCRAAWLAAVALPMAAILDNPQHVASQPAAARQLVAVLDTLSKRTYRRGKLAVVKSMTEASGG